MKSFILHVYSRDIRSESHREDHEIVDVVESVEDEKQTPFTSTQELWEILLEKYPEIPEDRIPIKRSGTS